MLDGGYNAAQAASARSFLPLPGGICECVYVCLPVCPHRNGGNGRDLTPRLPLPVGGSLPTSDEKKFFLLLLFR